MTRRHQGLRRVAATLLCAPLLVGCIARASDPATSPDPGLATAGPSPSVRPNRTVPPSGATPVSPAPTTSPVTGGDSEAILARVAPSVVFVTTPLGGGSAVVLDARHVLTSAHVVRPFAEARVVDSKGNALGTGRAVGWDLVADLAILRIGQPITAEPLPAGEPAALAIGDRVYIVGYPEADPDEPRVRIRPGVVTGEALEWHDGLTYHDSDAPSAGGQSGGALVDATGRLVGITGGVREGRSVSLDADDALARAARLIRGDDVDGLADRLLPLATSGAAREQRGRIQNKADDHVWIVTGDQGDDPAQVRLTADGGDVGMFSMAGAGAFASGRAQEGTDLELEVGFEPPPPYFVKVQSLGSRPVDVTLRSDVGLTPFEDPDDGRALTIGAPYRGVADYSGDVDWSTISLADDERILIRVAAAAFDVALFVDDVASDRTLLVGQNVGGPLGFDDELIFQAPHAGDYRIVITDPRFLGSGAYRLEITRP